MKNCPLNKLPVAELQHYVDLVHFIARRMQKRLPASIELDDLVSAGLVGLTQALEKFDPKKGTRFKSFAEFRIRGAMLDELRAQDWAPKGIRRRVKQYHQISEKIMQTTGHKPSDTEIREHLKLSKSSYARLLEAVRSLDQMNAASYQDSNAEGPGCLENICDEHPEPDAICAEHEVRNYFVHAMLHLEEKIQKILMLHYFEDLSFREIGQELGCSESRISQLHAEGVKMLRNELSHDKSAHDAIDVLSSAA